MIVEHIVDQRSEEWFNERAGFVTSSVVTAIMAVKGLGSGAHTLAKKLAWQKLKGIEEDDLDTFHMKRGRELEPLAFKEAGIKLAEEFKTIRESGFFFNSTLQTGSSPDGVISDNGLYEAKAPEMLKLVDILVDDNFTPEKDYFNQMQHQLLTTGKDYVLHHNYALYKSKDYSHFSIIKPCKVTQNLMQERLILMNALIGNYHNKLVELGI